MWHYTTNITTNCFVQINLFNYPLLILFKQINTNDKINPLSPLKFNKLWLQDETFKNLFLTHWNPITGENERSNSIQFVDNIKRLKVFIKEWETVKRSREDAELKNVEAELLVIYEGEGGGLSTQESKEVLTRLEGRRNTLLFEKEEACRLKGKAIWL